MATFRTRTGRHGDTTVTVMVRMAGFPTQTATFPNKTEAKRWAAKTEADILEGRTSKDSLGRKRTLAEAIERYRREVVPGMKSGTMYGFTLDWWATNHGTKKLGEVSRGWLTECRTELLTGTFRRSTPGSKRSLYKGPALVHGFDAKPPLPAGLAIKGSHYAHAQDYTQPQAFQRTPATANRYMAALSSVFSQVCGDWEWLQANANPFTGLSKLREGKGRTRHLSDQERARLLQETAKDPQLHTLVQVALATGARAGELTGLVWACVELGETEGRLLFTDTKNGEARIAWVFGEALRALDEHRAPLVEAATMDSVSWRAGITLQRPVFPGQWSHKHQRYGKYDYMPRLRKALKAAGIADFRFHDLRHTALTGLAKMGVNGHQLKAISGHKSDVINRYVHIAAQDTKAAALAYQSRETGK
jgi:integrase